MNGKKKMRENGDGGTPEKALTRMGVGSGELQGEEKKCKKKWVPTSVAEEKEKNWEKRWATGWECQLRKEREREEKEQEWRGNGGKKLGAGPPWELEAKKLKKERKSEEREKIREKRRERGEVTWGGMSVVWAGESRWMNEL